MLATIPILALLGLGSADASEPDEPSAEVDPPETPETPEKKGRKFQADDIVTGARDRPDPVASDALPSPKVEVHGLAEAALEGWATPGEDLVYGAAIHLARLQARFEDPGHFGAVIQVEGASGKVDLLDAAARVGDRGGHNLLVGRFKTFLSDDYLVPAGKMIFPTRGLLTGISTKRMVGAQGTGRFGDVRVKAGLFNPTSLVPEPGLGAVLMAGLDVELSHGMHIHTAATHWLRPVGALDALEEDDRVWQNQVDLAVVHHENGWTVAAEGLVARHPGVGWALDSAWDAGLLGVVARRFPVSRRIEIEPAMAWDTLWKDEELTHRASTAFNLHKEDWRMVETVAVELEQDKRHAGLTKRLVVQLQVAL